RRPRRRLLVHRGRGECRRAGAPRRPGREGARRPEELLRSGRGSHRLSHRPGVVRRAPRALREAGPGRAGGERSSAGRGVSGPAPLALDASRPLRESAIAVLRVADRFRGGLAAVCTELCAPHPPLGEVESHHRAAEAAHRLARRLLEIDGIQVVVRGTVHSGPAVWVSTHLSYLDPLVFGAMRPMVAIAKAELARWPLLGRLALRTGTLFVRRGDPHHGARVLRQALRRLAAGIPVLNFPEGTTTDGSGALLPFRRGVFGLARRAGVPVVP